MVIPVTFPLHAACMASIHHFIGWDAWLLPSSPWQCECPPASYHHGNGSVPQQPSAWAKCKPLNQNHHGNMCLPKHRALVCLRVYFCCFESTNPAAGAVFAEAPLALCMKCSLLNISVVFPWNGVAVRPLFL